MQSIHYYFLELYKKSTFPLYRKLITQLCTYTLAIRVHAKGYLPNTVITPRKLQEILAEVKKSLHHTNPDYTLVLDRLHLNYDMQLVTFGIDKDISLVIQFWYSYNHTQRDLLILYQLETVPVPVLDENTEANTPKSKEALHSFKFRDIYFTNTSRIKIMQENRK